MNSTQSTPQDHAIVIGSGWSALAATGYLMAAGRNVTWIPSLAPRLMLPLPVMDLSQAAPLWIGLASRLGIGESFEYRAVSDLREFRNKAFREPLWTKAPTPDARREVMKELLWPGEESWVPAFEARVAGLEWSELFEQMRGRLVGAVSEGFEVEDVSWDESAELPVSVKLGSGSVVQGSELWYCDQGLAGRDRPKLFGHEVTRDHHGVWRSALQVVFTHAWSDAAREQIPTQQSFFGALTRDAGEDQARHVWGSFLQGGSKSVWTVLLTDAESEDNHEISKKLRRMKQALEKMFEAQDLLGSIRHEQVRLVPQAVFAEGNLSEAGFKHADGCYWITDALGPGKAIEAVSALWNEGRKQSTHADTEVAPLIINH